MTRTKQKISIAVWKLRVPKRIETALWGLGFRRLPDQAAAKCFYCYEADTPLDFAGLSELLAPVRFELMSYFAR